MERYKFAQMLGPAHDKPAGSYERAECFGNELDYTVERVTDAVDGLSDLVKRILADDPPPWTVFPDPPCGSLDAFLLICCGIERLEIVQVLDTFGHPDLAADVANAAPWTAREP
jgi:hypothetical protein